MSQSLAKVLVHLVFSTKHRQPWIREDIREETQAYLIGILRSCESPALVTHAQPDYVHILFHLSKKHALTEIVEEVKKNSSRWLKSRDSACAQFFWQTGYGAFSVGEAEIDRVTRYIAGQPEHHRRVTFQEELRTLLHEHGIAFDERYLWD